MPIKIRVMNCQSIRDATIVVDGFTVITGANNSGKTAFLRAVKAVFVNASVGALVRHGADDMVVGIDFGDGHSVVFKKGKVKPTYVIDGGKPLHPGGSVPDELVQVGVYPLEVGGDKLWPQIATQFPDGKFSGPIFLLDKPGRIMAEVVADVERVGRLSGAMKLCDSDRRAAVSNLKVRRKDKGKIEDELTGFLGLDTLVETTDKIEGALTEAGRIAAEVVVLTDLGTRYDSRASEVQVLRGIEQVPIPPQEPFAEAARTLFEAQALLVLETRHGSALNAVRAVEGVGSVEVPAVALVIAATDTGRQAGELRKLGRRRDDAANAVASLAGVGGVAVPDVCLVEGARTLAVEMGELRQLEARLVKATSEVADRQAAHEVATGIEIDPAPWELAEKVTQGIRVLDGLAADLKKARDAVKAAGDASTQADLDLDTIRIELVELMGEVETCPVCRTPMVETHLHGEIT